MKRLYFAYGSNMSQERLEKRVGSVTKIGTHTLYGYKLVFNAGNAYANIEMCPYGKHFVEGVIYEMTIQQMRRLDTAEGFPHFYQRMSLPIIDKGILRDLHVYFSINPGYLNSVPLLPLEEYISYLIQGCKENNLEHTLDILSKMEVQPTFKPKPKRKKKAAQK